MEDAENLGVLGWGSGGLGLWGVLVMVTCWWIDTLPVSAIFMMLLANSSSGGDSRGLSQVGCGHCLGSGAWGLEPGAGWKGPSPRLALFSVQASSSLA